MTRTRVTPELLSQAPAGELGIAPAQATETQTSSDSVNAFSTTWIVRFPDNTPPFRAPYSSLELARLSSCFLRRKQSYNATAAGYGTTKGRVLG